MKRREFITNTGLLTVGALSLSSFEGKSDGEKTEVSTSIIPKRLKSGDTIALIAPAGAIFNINQIQKIETKLNNLGFKVVKGKTLNLKNGFLAGTDKERAQELTSFFKDKSINAILAMRGGWGCARILDLLDYDIIKNNPKIIMGYSDITSLLIAITTKTNLITYHGPVGYSSWKTFSTQQVFKTLVDGKPFTMINPNNYKNDLQTLTKGRANGKLIGGNLTVLTSMIGTRHEPCWKNKILFLEETGEEPYRIDRMLWQLKQANVFEQINGLVIGAFTKCEADDVEKSFSLIEILNQHFKNTNFPVYMGATIGHIVPKFTLPIGLRVEINTDEFTIKTLQNSVS